jgi:O-antigen/teichoic acid export membrane protein
MDVRSACADLSVAASPSRFEKTPRLSVSFGWVAAGNLLYAACQWGTLVVLAKAGDAAMVGEYALALAITAPVMLLLGANLRSLVATDAQHSYAFAEYLGLRLLTTMAALLFVLALTTTAPQDLFWVLLAVGVSKAVEAISDLFTGGFQQHERMSIASRSLVLRGMTGLLALALTLLRGGTLAQGMCALAAAWLLVLLLHDRPMLARTLRAEASDRSLGPRFDGRRLRSLLVLAAPLGLVAMLASLSLNIPRYFLQHSLGTEGVGIYAGIASFLLIGMLVMNALGAAVAPRLARDYARRDFSSFLRQVRGLTAIAIALGALSAVVLALSGPVLLRLLLSSRYEPFAGDLARLMLGAPAAYAASLLSYAATAARRLVSQGVVLVLASASIAAAGAVLIPAQGVRGAVWATVIGLTVQALGTLVICFTASRSAHA